MHAYIKILSQLFNLCHVLLKLIDVKTEMKVGKRLTK